MKYTTIPKNLNKKSVSYCKFSTFLTLALLGIVSFFPKLALAQLIPDDTLGAERSLVNSGVEIKGEPADLIEGGAIRGSNLFHSFQEFNVEALQRVYFNNPSAIENILTRVTGENISNILGTLGVDGAANLFLLNPNGIVFGANARLDINGSFFATTAESIVFEEFDFSTSNPTAPPLLTINRPIGLRIGETPGEIVVRTLPPALTSEEFNEVNDAGQSLETAGVINDETSPFPRRINGELSTENDVDLYRLSLEAETSFSATTVEGTIVDTALFLFDEEGFGLVANDDSDGTFQSTLPTQEIAEAGTVYLGISSFFNRPVSEGGAIFSDGFGDLTPTSAGGGSPLAGYTEEGQQSGAYTIFLSNPNLEEAGGLQVPAGETLALIGGNVQLEGGQIQAPGADVQLGGLSQEGIITIAQQSSGAWSVNLPENIPRANVTLTEEAVVNTRSSNGGAIAIVAENLDISEASQLLAGIEAGSGFPDSQGGAITLNATESISILGGSQVTNNVEEGGIGNAGNITATAAVIEITGEASFIDANTLGEGNAGNVAVEASDRITLSGGNTVQGLITGISSQVGPNAQGNGGNVTLKAPILEVLNGAQISTSTFGQGDGGQVIITVSDRARLAGTNPEGFASGTFSDVSFGATGNAGSVTLNAGTLAVEAGAQIRASTLGQGNGGDIRLNVGILDVLDGGQISADVVGEGDGGEVFIEASDRARFQGTDPDGFPSVTGSIVAPDGTGNAGNVTLIMPVLEVWDGATISVSTFGEGDAGGVVIEGSDRVTLSDGGIGSQVSSETAIGNAGGVTLTVPTLELLAGSLISGDTLGKGNAGEITVNVETLTVLEGSQIAVSVFGEGNAGQIEIRATEQVRLQGSDRLGFSSGFVSTVQAGATGNAGGVRLSAPVLEVLDGAAISASTFGEGNAGSVVLSVAERAYFEGSRPDGFPSNAGSDVGSRARGNSGDVTLTAPVVEVVDGAALSASTFGRGNAGSVIVNASERLLLSGGIIQSQVTDSGVGNAGGINLTTPVLEVLAGGQISASVFGEGRAGQIIITTFESAKFQGSGDEGNLSGAFSTLEAGAVGQAGGIEVNTRELSLLNGATLNVSTLGELSNGTGDLQDNNETGNLIINSDRAILETDATLTAETVTGDRGNILLNLSDRLILIDNSDITTNATGEATGGNISINSQFIIAPFSPRGDGSDISANAQRGDGGRINVTSEGIFGIRFREQPTPNNDFTVTSEFGAAGEFVLNNPDVNPSQGLFPLPSSPIDVASLIDRRCQATESGEESSFVVIGRGGLPASPTRPLMGDEFLPDFGTPEIEWEEQSHLSPQEWTADEFVNLSLDRAFPPIICPKK